MASSSITRSDLQLLSQLSRLAYCNPFSPDRIEAEKQVLGSEFVADQGIAWSRSLGVERSDRSRPNVDRITALAIELVDRIRQCSRKQPWPPETLSMYWDVATYVLAYQHVVDNTRNELLDPAKVGRVWQKFLKRYKELGDLPGLASTGIQPAGHLFACLCQVHRAFIHIFDSILGNSMPSVRLRRMVWESIFTNDLRRYRRSLYDQMGRLPTLITGPSGTGKELVARAIGLSQYIPFDENKICFAESNHGRFHALNLSAMSETLIESELFGHRKGAYTGAVDNRTGWLEQCPPHGAIFLDEIGELDLTLQVKLLRVVQQRTFSRIGESRTRTFPGKLIAATNRNLDTEMQQGRFREDFYYRLCSDRVQTPSLREQLDDRPDDLRALTLYIARGLAGDDAEQLCDEAVAWIRTNLGTDYPWRGNIRELEQCVSSILIRGEYAPSNVSQASSPSGAAFWLEQIRQGKLNCDQVLQKYCTWTYFRAGSYESAARLLGLDRRTVKSRIDQAMLTRLRQG